MPTLEPRKQCSLLFLRERMPPLPRKCTVVVASFRSSQRYSYCSLDCQAVYLYGMSDSQTVQYLYKISLQVASVGSGLPVLYFLVKASWTQRRRRTSDETRRRYTVCFNMFVCNNVQYSTVQALGRQPTYISWTPLSHAQACVDVFRER